MLLQCLQEGENISKFAVHTQPTLRSLPNTLSGQYQWEPEKTNQQGLGTQSMRYSLEKDRERLLQE